MLLKPRDDHQKRKALQNLCVLRVIWIEHGGNRR